MDTKRIIIFDTECSMKPGFKPQEMLQFGAVVTDTTLENCELVSEYFIPNSAIDHGSFNIHKITPQICEKYSKHDFFEVYCKESELFSSDLDTIYIAHNTAFDIGVVNKELEEAGEDIINFGKKVSTIQEALITEGNTNLDTVNYFRDRTKFTKTGGLEAGVAQYFNKLDGLKKYCEELAERGNIPMFNIDFHNAMFDSFIVYTMLVLMKERGRLI